MNGFLVLPLGLVASTIAWAADSFYCPQNTAYIHVGMSADQVIAACGQPLSKQQTNTPVTQKVPVKQLIFNNEGSARAFYGVWSIPVGTNGGATMQVNVINNKVSSITLNGNNTNAYSLCGGVNIQVGDAVGAVYNACGSPSAVNNTFINQPIQSSTKPEIWIYQPNPYQPPLSLTILDGKLQSIN